MMIESAQRAQIHDFISTLPDEYETVVGENGKAISGGERQRLAICQALLKQPRLLLLDEATSALDAITEARLREAINQIRPGRTIIAVAHRLSTIIQADTILVIDQGRLVEAGTPAELISMGGQFCQIYQAQQLK